MTPRQKRGKTYVNAGHAFLPAEPAWLYAVVGSGVAVAMYDQGNKRGGLTYFARPKREPNKPSTAVYAAPAIVSLLQMFAKAGSSPEDLEAMVYGGASSPDSPDYEPGLDKSNVEAALELLRLKRVRVAGSDVGGRYGRKVGFHTGSGETIVAKVNNLRPSDWYPQVSGKTDNAADSNHSGNSSNN